MMTTASVERLHQQDGPISFPEFALDRSLRPCLLTRDLLAQIEKYLATAERDLMGEIRCAPDRKFDLSVHDAFGVETFSSASAIPTAGFPESTENVRLTLETFDGEDPAELTGRYLKLKLAFRGRHGNRLLLRIRGPQSRERVVGLVDRIDQLVHANALDGGFLRTQEELTGIVGAFAFLGGFFWLFATYNGITKSPPVAPTHEYWAWTAAITSAASYWAFVRFFVPACAFETRRWSKLDEWRRWAKLGLAGVVVLDGVAFFLWTYVGRIFGFP
jgi:hypothetical protein